MIYNMGIYFRNKLLYEIEVEADSIEQAREFTWDNFIDVAYADEVPVFHPCGDCAEYPDCTKCPNDCEYSYAYKENK